jgi:hypothetical protein
MIFWVLAEGPSRAAYSKSPRACPGSAGVSIDFLTVGALDDEFDYERIDRLTAISVSENGSK